MVDDRVKWRRELQHSSTKVDQEFASWRPLTLSDSMLLPLVPRTRMRLGASQAELIS
uniref:Uncharacterized protein n=1 Tax=Pseudomonas aeruginosa TaxID=287 RepID=A0A6C0L1B4_PSEAI|nr:hypothetical protein [Pseudomonas aeruginosa]